MELCPSNLFFIESSKSPYFVGSLVSHQTIYLNQAAQDMFGMTVETCDYSKIFHRSETHIGEIIQSTLKEAASELIYDMAVKKRDGKTLLVDLQLGFFNEKKRRCTCK